MIGGAGSIGSQFIKALLEYRPASLVVVDSSENGLTELTRDLRSTADQFIPDDFRTYPVALGTAVFDRLLASEGPFDIVADFAAHKHVRSEKDRFAIEAMLHTNVIDTVHLMDALLEHPPQRFFCVSTDKAANPANVMGASKKLMEDAVIAYAARMPASTARFANVAFSNGSLPDGFLRRLALRQPLSAPSDVRRYFVSPQESGQLCLLACVLGEPGDILFPRLDEPTTMTFASIADALLEELGYTPVVCATEDEAKAFAADRHRVAGLLLRVRHLGREAGRGIPHRRRGARPRAVRGARRREGDSPDRRGGHPRASAQDLIALFDRPDLDKSEHRRRTYRARARPSSTSRPVAASTRGCRCTGGSSGGSTPSSPASRSSC